MKEKQKQEAEEAARDPKRRQEEAYKKDRAQTGH